MKSLLPNHMIPGSVLLLDTLGKRRLLLVAVQADRNLLSGFGRGDRKRHMDVCDGPPPRHPMMVCLLPQLCDLTVESDRISAGFKKNKTLGVDCFN